jgi:hypothetical protein
MTQMGKDTPLPKQKRIWFLWKGKKGSYWRIVKMCGAKRVMLFGCKEGMKTLLFFRYMQKEGRS